VVEDQLAFADLLVRVLEADAEFTVSGRARTLDELQQRLRGPAPDVVLLDYRLPDGDSLGCVSEISSRWPGTKIVLLSGFSNAYVDQQARVAGCDAVVSKLQPAEEVIETLRAVLDGGRAPARAGAPEPAPVLTPRELEVLGLLADGRTNATIARELGISLTTQRNHVQNILAKLGVSSQLEAVIAGVRLGLVDVGSST
jgi:DNA-binding NarL/FixJ family response regulator